MAVFPSMEFVKEIEELLDKNPEYKKAGADWEGDIITVVEAEANLLDEPFIYYSKPHHGEVLESYQLKSVDEKEAAYIISAPYSVFKAIIKGELDPMKAMLQGKIQVKGNMQQLLKYAKFQQLGMDALKHVTPTFIDEEV